MAERNLDLAEVSDHEIAVRIGVLLTVADAGFDDVRVYRPLDQMQTLLSELIARHPRPDDQIVQLSTLKMRGELHS